MEMHLLQRWRILEEHAVQPILPELKQCLTMNPTLLSCILIIIIEMALEGLALLSMQVFSFYRGHIILQHFQLKNDAVRNVLSLIFSLVNVFTRLGTYCDLNQNRWTRKALVPKGVK